MDLGPTGQPAPRSPQPFTAWVSCPTCGRHECHAIRSPRPAPTPAELAEWERTHDTEVVYVWGRREPVATRHTPPRPVDESGFEVVRICRCGHEWGMV